MLVTVFAASCRPWTVLAADLARGSSSSMLSINRCVKARSSGCSFSAINDRSGDSTSSSSGSGSGSGMEGLRDFRVDCGERRGILEAAPPTSRVTRPDAGVFGSDTPVVAPIVAAAAVAGAAADPSSQRVCS